MSRNMRLFVAYGASMALLVALGAWISTQSRRARAESEAAGAQLADVQALLQAQPFEGMAGPAGHAGGPRRAGSIGGTIQRAVSQSRLTKDSIEEVRGVELDQGGLTGSQPCYRVRLTDVGVEPLVRFIYALDAEAGLRAIELDMSRKHGRTRRWDVSLLVVGLR